MDNNTNKSIQEEISLVELITAMWNGKVIIALFTLAAFIFTLVFAKFTYTEKYSSRITIKPSEIKLTSTTTSDDKDLFSEIDEMLTLTTEQYANYLTSTAFLQTLQQMTQDKSQVNIEDIDLLRSMITTDIPDKKSVVIEVISDDPNVSFAIADSLYDAYISYVDSNIKSKIKGYLDASSANLENSREELNERSQELTNFRLEHENIEILSDEVARLKDLISNTKNSINSLENNLASNIKALDLITNNLSQDEITALIDTTLMSEIRQEFGSSSNQISPNYILSNDLLNGNNQVSNAMLLIEMNKLQIEILNDYTELNILEDKIITLDQDYLDTQNDHLSLNPDYINIKYGYDIALSTYRAQSRKFSAAQSIDTLDLVRPSVVLVSEPDLATSPLPHSSISKIIIGTGFGFLLGVIIVLLKHYWILAKKQKQLSIG